MLISFELTMPNVNSWNGKWTGEGKKYYVIKNYPKSYIDRRDWFKRLRETGRDSWYYRWEDGWGASVIVEVINGKEAAKRRKVSAGFCGYYWMIDSIFKIGKISASHETETIQQ